MARADGPAPFPIHDDGECAAATVGKCTVFAHVKIKPPKKRLAFYRATLIHFSGGGQATEALFK